MPDAAGGVLGSSPPRPRWRSSTPALRSRVGALALTRPADRPADPPHVGRRAAARDRPRPPQRVAADRRRDRPRPPERLQHAARRARGRPPGQGGRRAAGAPQLREVDTARPPRGRPSFGLILPDCGLGEAFEVLDRVRARHAARPDRVGRRRPLGRRGAGRAAASLRCADALAAAKAAGARHHDRGGVASSLSRAGASAARISASRALGLRVGPAPAHAGLDRERRLVVVLDRLDVEPHDGDPRRAPRRRGACRSAVTATPAAMTVSAQRGSSRRRASDSRRRPSAKWTVRRAGADRGRDRDRVRRAAAGGEDRHGARRATSGSMRRSVGAQPALGLRARAGGCRARAGRRVAAATDGGARLAVDAAVDRAVRLARAARDGGDERAALVAQALAALVRRLALRRATGAAPRSW